jgi:hypothetical protein
MEEVPKTVSEMQQRIASKLRTVGANSSDFCYIKLRQHIFKRLVSFTAEYCTVPERLTWLNVLTVAKKYLSLTK